MSSRLELAAARSVFERHAEKEMPIRSAGENASAPRGRRQNNPSLRRRDIKSPTDLANAARKKASVAASQTKRERRTRLHIRAKWLGEALDAPAASLLNAERMAHWQ